MKRLERIPARYRKQANEQLRKLSQKLQARREELDLTQEALAEKLDISTVTLKAIEQGRRYPSLPMLFYVCGVLGISIRLD